MMNCQYEKNFFFRDINKSNYIFGQRLGYISGKMYSIWGVIGVESLLQSSKVRFYENFGKIFFGNFFLKLYENQRSGPLGLKICMVT